MIRAISNQRRRDRGHLALLLGLPATVIAVVAMTVAPASAATPVSAAAHHGAPASHKPASHKPLSGVRANDSCLMELGGLTPTATTVFEGTHVTLTATTNCDVGPTQYYLQIWDVTTGTLVGSWGNGSSRNGIVVQNAATTHGYVAYLDAGGSSFPPTGVYQQSATIYVTWTAQLNPFSVTLTGPAVVGYGQGPATYVATTNQDLRPTPYYLGIFDETTGTELTVVPCGVGTTCAVSFTPSFGGDNLVAFVSYFSSALPPAGTQASSNVLNTFQLPFIQ